METHEPPGGGGSSPNERPRRYAPVAVDLAGVRCLVVGGGHVATRKVLTLVQQGADVLVLSPEVSSSIAALIAKDTVQWRQERYDASSLEGISFVVAATSDPDVNLRILADAEARTIWCNVAAPGRASRVIFPATHRTQRGMTVAVHSDGTDVLEACRTRDELARMLAGRDPTTERVDRLAREAGPAEPPEREGAQGRVCVVGVGPADPDLITLRGYRALRQADVIIRDSRVPRSFLEELSVPSSTVVHDGPDDDPGNPSRSAITAAMMDGVRAGKSVVHLVSDDPIACGHSAEELHALTAHGIAWEVIPGPGLTLDPRGERALPQQPLVLFTGLDTTLFRHLGRLLHVPALSIEAVPDGLAEFPAILEGLARSECDWVVFTDRVGIRSFFRALADRGLDTRILAGARVLAAGHDTARRLDEHGILPDVVAVKPGSSGIVQALGTPKDTTVLLVPGIHAPRNLAAALREHGAQVTHLITHRLTPNPDLGAPLPEYDAVYFVSPAGVRSYWNAYGAAAFQREVWCLGEGIRQIVTELGFEANVVPPEADSPVH